MDCILGHFLAEEDVEAARQLALQCPHDEASRAVVLTVLSRNWETETQMVANLLQNPELVPAEVRSENFLKGMSDLSRPYYCLSSAVGAYRTPLPDVEQGKLIQGLKRLCLVDDAHISSWAFLAVQRHLKHPEDDQFVLDILAAFLNRRTPLRRNASLWLLSRFADRNSLSEGLTRYKVAQSVQEDLLTQAGPYYLKETDQTEDMGCFISLVPSLTDYEAMRSKERMLVEFFNDIDKARTGFVSCEAVRQFLDDIGFAAPPLSKLVHEVLSLGCVDPNFVECDLFVELLFPKFNT